MGRKDALASVIGRGEGTKRSAEEVARDIDWRKVRRVQHGLSRPPETHARLSCGLLTYEEMERADTRRRRARRLAHLLATISGVLIGLAFLRGFAGEPALLAAAFMMAIAGVVSLSWSLA
jgi:hypothetical protein